METVTLRSEGRQALFWVTHLEKDAETAQKWNSTVPEVSHETGGIQTDTNQEEEMQ